MIMSLSQPFIPFPHPVEGRRITLATRTSPLGRNIEQLGMLTTCCECIYRKHSAGVGVILGHPLGAILTVGISVGFGGGKLGETHSEFRIRSHLTQSVRERIITQAL